MYTCKHYKTLYIQYVSSKLKYLQIKLDWGLRVPFRSACQYLYTIVYCRKLLALSLFHWLHMGRLCHWGWHTLRRLRVLVLRCKMLQMRLGFSVNNTICCNYLVTSWFRTQTLNYIWVLMLASESWYMTSWPT